LTCALTMTLAPVALFAQDPPVQQQPPAPAQPEQSKEPRLSFTGDAGILLFQIKPDQTAGFEELVTKVRDVLSKSEDPVRKQQLDSWKIYKASEPMAQNALYVLVVDPVVKGAEYDLFALLAEGLGKEYGTPENQAMMKRFVEVFAVGPNRLNLTPIAR
jgi:hypothetical protein